MAEGDTHLADPVPGEDTDAGPARGYPGMPRWVKLAGIIALVLVLLVVVLMVAGVGGRHGPGRHLPSGGAGDRTPTIEHSARWP